MQNNSIDKTPRHLNPDLIASDELNNLPQMDNLHSVNHVEFLKQPPENLRKSNFFHFVIRLWDESNRSIHVTTGRFAGFIERTEEEKLTRNGMVYCLSLIYADGHACEQNLYFKLIDSLSRQVVAYEGQDKNPQMCHVLLTHELMCSRCSERKSCGNRNETPSDPVIADRTFIKVFMKCNQNCLKNAGNPKDNRRFQIAIATTSDLSKIVGISDKMFVHNNSKHGRRHSSSNKKDGLITLPPTIRGIIPAEGWIAGGTQVIIIGEHFFEGLQVLFGDSVVWTVEVFSSTALRVVTPSSATQGVVEVVTSLNSRPFCWAPALSEPTIDNGFQRLSRLVPRYPGDSSRLSKEMILKRAADLVESVYCNSNSTNGLTILQQQSATGHLGNEPLNSGSSSGRSSRSSLSSSSMVSTAPVVLEPSIQPQDNYDNTNSRFFANTPKTDCRVETTMSSGSEVGPQRRRKTKSRLLSYQTPVTPPLEINNNSSNSCTLPHVSSFTTLASCSRNSGISTSNCVPTPHCANGLSPGLVHYQNIEDRYNGIHLPPTPNSVPPRTPLAHCTFQFGTCSPNNNNQLRYRHASDGDEPTTDPREAMASTASLPVSVTMTDPGFGLNEACNLGFSTGHVTPFLTLY